MSLSRQLITWTYWFLSITHRLLPAFHLLNILQSSSILLCIQVFMPFIIWKPAILILRKAMALINFASGAGLFGNFGQCAQAAKEGIRGLTRVAATEWAKDGITVNIMPRHHSLSSSRTLIQMHLMCLFTTSRTFRWCWVWNRTCMYSLHQTLSIW